MCEWNFFCIFCHNTFWYFATGSLAPAAIGKQAAVADGGAAGTTDADADLQARLDDLRRE